MTQFEDKVLNHKKNPLEDNCFIRIFTENLKDLRKHLS